MPTSQTAEPSPSPEAATSEPHAYAQGQLLELSRDECLRLLAEHHFGRLVVRTAKGAPIIRPVNYVFDHRLQSVVFRTAAGTKFHALLRSADATFEIDCIDETARTGWSVIVQGVTSEVIDPSTIRRLDGLRLETWAPGPKCHWMHVRARTVSGRRIVLAAGASRLLPRLGSVGSPL
jgi:hypothetical protein